MKKLLNKIPLLACFAMLLFLAASSSSASADDQNSKFSLQVKDKHISLSAEGVGVKEILSKLDESAGIKVIIYDGVEDKKISVKIQNLPLYAIDTLLKKMSLERYAVVYDRQRASFVVYILPEGKDISEVAEGNDIVAAADFSYKDNTAKIKNREIVSIATGRDNVPVRYVKDEMILKFHRGVTQAEIDEILEKYDLAQESDDTLAKLGYVKVRVPDGRDIMSVGKELAKERKLKTQEPNYILNTLMVADPLFNDQWYIPDTNFVRAWDGIDNGVSFLPKNLKGWLCIDPLKQWRI